MSKTLRLEAYNVTGDYYIPEEALCRIGRQPSRRAKVWFTLPAVLRIHEPTDIVLHLIAGRPSGETDTADYTGSLSSYPTQEEAERAIRNMLVKVSSAGMAGNVPGDITISQISERRYRGTVVYQGISDTELTLSGQGYISKIYQAISDGGIDISGPGYGGFFDSSDSYVYVASDELQDTYVDITYNEGDPETVVTAIQGVAKKDRPITLNWVTRWEGYPIESIPQQSATIEWKDGSSGTVHSIYVSDDSESYTLPANTLPTSMAIMWRVIATTAEGTSTSAWSQIRTLDSIPAVNGVSPSGVYADGYGSIRFSWKYSISTGTEQEGFDLQVKQGDNDWTTIVEDPDSHETHYDAEAGALASGPAQWRVRGYNTTGVPSDWSQPLSFVVVAAPAAPQVTVTGTDPRATIVWSADDQQAYQIIIGTYDSGIVYGSEKAFTTPMLLPDGMTSFYVRIMNSFGFWSEYGTAAAIIENTPRGRFDISAYADQNATITWSASARVSSYIVFRDGEQIAVLPRTETRYVDTLAIGRHAYQVYNVYTTDTTYTPSNVVEVDISVDRPVIAELGSEEWLSLEYTLTSLPSTESTIARDVHLMQYDGLDYPDYEVGEARTHEYKINVAYATSEDGQLLERLLGKTVVLKNQYGELIVGVIASLKKSQNAFTVSYSGTLTEVHHEGS